jgi:hypothetical protein
MNIHNSQIIYKTNMVYTNRMDDYLKYMSVDESDRHEIRNKYSDEEMFNSMLECNRINNRKNAYPQIEEQLDMIYKHGLEHWRSEIEKIKARYNEIPGYTCKYEDTRISELQTTRTDLQAEKAKVAKLELLIEGITARMTEHERQTGFRM